MNNIFSNLDSSWTLFLDRDGVLNHEIKNDYIKSEEEMKPIIESIQSLSVLTDFFYKTIIVTNQKGVGKGLFTEEDLEKVNQKLINEIEKKGGKIDKLYYCTDIDNRSMYRKPNTGMAQLAQKDFPEIDFEKSIMIGDTLSDMLFAKRLKMKTVLIFSSITPEQNISDNLVDYKFNNLQEFINIFLNEIN